MTLNNRWSLNLSVFHKLWTRRTEKCRRSFFRRIPISL